MMDEVMLRLKRLERHLRIGKSVLLVAVGAYAISEVLKVNAGDIRPNAPTSSPAQDVLRSRRIEVVNARGAVVFSVDTDVVGGGVMELRYGNGKTLLTAGAGDFGEGGLAVCSTEGNPVVLLGPSLTKNKAGGMLQIISKNAVPVLFATTDENEEGLLMLLNKDGKTIKKLGPRS